MTLPISQAISRLEDLVHELEEEWPRIVERNGMDAIALIEERITKFGVNHNGNPLEPYTKPYKRFKEHPHGTSKKGNKRGKELGVGPTSRYKGHVDYSFTGNWWRDIQPIQTIQQGTLVKTIIGPRSDLNKKIMESLTKRDGFPLRLSQSEVDIIINNASVEVKYITEKYFG